MALQLTTLCCSYGDATMRDSTAPQWWWCCNSRWWRYYMQRCNDGDVVARDGDNIAHNVVTLQWWRCCSSRYCGTAKKQRFFSFLLHVCLLSFQCSPSFLLSSQEHSREKKKTEDTHKGKFKGTKKNDYVNHLNRRILDTHALDLDVDVRSGKPLHMVILGLLKLRWSSSAIGLHNSRKQQ